MAVIVRSRVLTERWCARWGVAAAGLGLLVAGGCGDGSAARKSVVVFHADSLSMPFEAIEEAFEKLHPDLDLQRTPSGSVMAANKILLGNSADVIAVADYLVIDDVLAPEGHTDWSICFATNEIGIAYTTASKHRAELTPENWFEILTRDDVTVGAGDPDNDPCGYWTELCWKLADKHYDGESVFDRMMKACPRADRPDDAQQLMARITSQGRT